MSMLCSRISVWENPHFEVQLFSVFSIFIHISLIRGNFGSF